MDRSHIYIGISLKKSINCSFEMLRSFRWRPLQVGTHILNQPTQNPNKKISAIGGLSKRATNVIDQIRQKIINHPKHILYNNGYPIQLINRETKNTTSTQQNQ